MKLPRQLDDLVESGRSNLEGWVDGGRRGARRLYADGRHWIDARLPDARDVRREADDGRERAERAARSAVSRAKDDDRLRAPVRWIEARLPEPRRTSSVLWPSVLAAAGAGVAFWWWTSWSRGRAEAAERAALDAAGGAAGQAHPEGVMAHAPEPVTVGGEPADVAASKLAEPAEAVMAHAPPPAEATAVGEVAPAKTVKALDESLAVQGAASKANGRHKPASGAQA